MNRSIIKPLSIAFMATAFLLSCSKDDEGSDPVNPSPEPETEVEKYVIAATPTATEGVADYLLTADDLSSGSISTVGNGIEQDGTYRYYVSSNNKFFSMLYGQGNPGAVTTYQLNEEGELEKLSDFQSETVQAFAAVNEDVLLVKISRNSTSPIAYWYRLNTESLTFVDEGQINQQELTEDDELAFFSWITQIGDKVYLPFFKVRACCNDTFGTVGEDNAYVAIYSYPEMELEKVIKDERASFIGRYFTKGLFVEDNGDAYAFSASVAQTNNEITSTKPSAVLRIKNGETEFDDAYYFDVETLAGGKSMTTWTQLGSGKYLVNMTESKTSAYANGLEYAIVDVLAKTYVEVSGIPQADEIQLLTARNNYVSEDGKTVSVGITLKDGGSYVYNIDVDSATASQGLKVEGGVITAIDKVKSK
ncbi:DUF4374 domain-containing protein [Marinilongibacter aquaticus]|uniref:DUF4374 domain-containing protein n=1 Tax=Marinilongibacter aquaticus TaxID=2975157 RepID=UPI0021BD99B3|nr:DUF4374 domain-containing protein [Marinilongibacter aquaticus]UBM59139.1 DUF4374 domain-containing protein [Marinilongibacter aquaticus]